MTVTSTGDAYDDAYDDPYHFGRTRSRERSTR